MEALSETTILFTIVLTLSMIVERLLEIGKVTIDLIDSRYHWHRFWTYRAKVLRDKLERRLRIYEYADQSFINNIVKAGNSILLGPDSGYNGTVPTISGDLVRALWIKLFLKSIAIIIGVSLAFHFNIDLVALWQNTNAQLSLPANETLPANAVMHPSFWGLMVSGATIGLGSGPVHKIIMSMEHGWQKKKLLQRMKKS